MADGLLSNISDKLLAFAGNERGSVVTQNRQTRDLQGQIQALPQGGVLGSEQLRQLAIVNPQAATAIANPLEALNTKRQEALFTDALRTSKLLEEGFSPQAAELLQNRLLDIQTLGGDPSDTQEILDVLQREGPEAARRLLEPTLIAGRAEGVLPTTAIVSELDKAKIAKLEEETRQLQGTPSRTDKDTQAQINVLRKDITAEGKAFSLVESARNRILKSGDKGTAASDISLIFNFMKMNDPGSTVREGEFATAQNAAGVSGRVISAYNNLLEGTRLNPVQRADFISQSERLFQAQRESFDNAIGRTLDQADADNIPRKRVLGAKRLSAFERRLEERAQIEKEDTEAGAADGATGQDVIPEGATATGPNGEKIQFINGQWVSI